MFTVATNKFFSLAETFYSIQGEGPTSGVPAVFLRLAGCNFQCAGFTYVDSESGEHLGCDSKKVWRSGRRYDFKHLLEEWEQRGFIQAFECGAHLIITGGEPLLQASALSAFFDAFSDAHPNVFSKLTIEIETNGSFIPSTDLFEKIKQWNISPKLHHSGESRQKAYHPDVLAYMAKHPGAYFKFVVTQPDDVHEIMTDYYIPLSLNPAQIILMPEGGSLEAIAQKKSWIVELCKKHGFRFSTRLQIDIWGEVTGV